MADIRTFIAIAIDETVLARLCAVQQRLRQADADVAWVRAAGMHLTLKFLGNIPEERVLPIGDALAEVVREFSPFAIEVAGTGEFPNRRAPRVIWAGVREGAESLRAVAEAVDRKLATLDLPREERPFRAHLTLGRVKSSTNLPQLITLLEEYAGEQFGEMRATEILLIRSDLSPTGAHYTTLRRAALVGDCPRQQRPI